MKRKILALLALFVVLALAVIPVGASNYPYYEDIGSTPTNACEMRIDSQNLGGNIYFYSTLVEGDVLSELQTAIELDPYNNIRNFYIPLADDGTNTASAMLENALLQNMGNDSTISNIGYVIQTGRASNQTFKSWGLNTISSQTYKTAWQSGTTYLQLEGRYSSTITLSNGNGSTNVTGIPNLRITVRARGDLTTNPYVHYIPSTGYMALFVRVQILRVPLTLESIDGLISTEHEYRTLLGYVDALEEAYNDLLRESTGKTMLGQTFLGLLRGVNEFMGQIFSLGWGDFTIGRVVTIAVISTIALWVIKVTFI